MEKCYTAASMKVIHSHQAQRGIKSKTCGERDTWGN